MNIGDKITWGYRSLFILMLVWLRFIEQYIPFVWIWLVWGIIVLIIFTQPFKRKIRTKQDTGIEQATSSPGGVG